jgi:hypothetical protein
MLDDPDEFVAWLKVGLAEIGEGVVLGCRLTTMVYCEVRVTFFDCVGLFVPVFRF